MNNNFKIHRNFKIVSFDTPIQASIVRYKFSKDDTQYFLTDKNTYRLIFVVYGKGYLNDEPFTEIDQYDLIVQNNTELELSFEERTEIITICVEREYFREGIDVYKYNNMKCMRNNFPLSLIPDSWYRLLSPSDIYLLAGPEKVFYNNDYADRSPDNFIMVMAEVPAESLGAPLHAHINSIEIFTIIEGSFKITINNRIYYADKGDLIIIQPNVYRKFENISDTNAMILPLVLGTNNESEDIVMAEEVKNHIIQEKGILGKILVWMTKQCGVQYE